MKILLGILSGIIIIGLLIWFKLPLFTIHETLWKIPKKVALKEYVEFKERNKPGQICGVAGCDNY